MKTVAIIQHALHDGPAFFATWMAVNGIHVEVFAMHAGSPLPRRIEDHAGLCILGGPMSANDDLAYFPGLQALVRDAIAQDIPVIGHCLGGQIMSLALGGSVVAASHVEIGWSDLSPINDEAFEWFGPSRDLRLFQWHGETFSIPPNATPLVTGTHCEQQAFVVNGKHLGMQFHCEVDVPKIATWLVTDAAEIVQSNSPAVQSARNILANVEQAVAQSQATASHIYGRWVQGLRPY